MDSSKLQGKELLAARREGVLTLTLQLGNVSIQRAVHNSDVWKDPDVVRKYSIGLARLISEALDEV